MTNVTKYRLQGLRRQGPGTCKDSAGAPVYVWGRTSCLGVVEMVRLRAPLGERPHLMCQRLDEGGLLDPATESPLRRRAP